MGTDAGADVLYEVADEIGLDADRFRLAQGASFDKLYLTGIELALAAAGMIAHRFLRGYIRGLRAAAKEAGLDPDTLGDRLGRGTVRVVNARVDALGERAASLLAGRPAEVLEQAANLGAEIDETLREAEELGAELTEAAREESRAAGVDEIAAALVENGFTPERATELAPRLTDRLDLGRR
ncbi:MAG TPA: hypothetical protein VK488_01670 [Gaiellaceae bacterium]|nr:hypothetical protein [Gaiellaceae bacterium]